MVKTVKIKICGLFRDADIDYVNEARPDYIGFVFAESRRRVSPEQAAGLRRRLSGDIVPVGVFVNAPIADIAALYRGGVISIAQLHGEEDGAYIDRLRKASAAGGLPPVPVIKAIKSGELESGGTMAPNADYYLFDSGAGSGMTFDWSVLNFPGMPQTPWFLAGGIGADNIEKAITFKPFGIDISSGAETGGVKDKEKILQLTAMVRKANNL
jgi:phosphoribosylanthranilate isomerase